MRCLTLADKLNIAGHQCSFICATLGGHIGGLIKEKGYKLSMLPRPENEASPITPNKDYEHWLNESWQQDAMQTFEVTLHDKPDWLVVDHYALDAKWERVLSGAVNKIMVIDDLANRPHECALLLDQNLGRVASDYDGLVPAETIRLIGPRFALLRPEFATLRARSLSRRDNPEIKRILITLGGTDRTNVTGQVLDALSKSNLPVSTELDIVMGPSALHFCKVRRQAEQLPFKTNVSSNVTDMAERMMLADLCIGAAGGTSWERCCLGLPTLLVVLAENQVASATALEASGAGAKIDDVAHLSAALPALLNYLFEKDQLKIMSDVAGAITNGDGSFKVVRAMSETSGYRVNAGT